MSTVISIASEPKILAKPSMRIGEIVPKMKEYGVKEIPVVDDDNRIIGILSYRRIAVKGVGRDTRVQSVMDPPFYFVEDTDIDRAIASIVNWRAREVPVVNAKGIVIGIVSRNNVLRYVYERGLLPRIRVETIMSSPPITINKDESIARARWLMNKSGISRLPVLDDNEKIVGVITLSDIIEKIFSIRLSRRKGYEWIQSEESFLAAPVSEFMSSPPIVAPPDIDVYKAMEILLNNNISGIPITRGDDRVIGVLSGIDILRKYVESLVALQPISAKISNAIEGDEAVRLQIEKLVNNYLSKFSRYLNVIDFKISVKTLTKSGKNESREGRKQFDVKIRVVTSAGAFASESICWDLPTCIREALEIIEKRIRKNIEKRMFRGRISTEEST
ncbi:putative signal transduction protein with CBS domains [Ignisphaera aggregans DSM 17230]|uniref:Putative signal transduction protein with CBS domains n=1 Tax=Ignisphaera aggregans (strain DSM 17230 / JCM 13409 / AQ1.S1) TaxID=583356 RepID=E0SRK6_IGNAA|nr:putative signal transduction protein with CBS domains [Ignisphaera aggregans DSM 17230]